MELFRGGPLADLIDKAGPLPTRRVAKIGLSVLEALHGAHAAGIVSPGHQACQSGRQWLAGGAELISALP